MKIFFIIILGIAGAIFLFFLILAGITEIQVSRMVRKREKYRSERAGLYMIIAQILQDKVKFLSENESMSDAQIQKQEKWISFEREYGKAHARIEEINAELKKLK